MASPEHHNFDYSGGVPLAIGDRYYGQDLGRDFWYLLNRQGALLKAFIGSTNVKLSGGTVSKNDWTSIDITAATVLVQYSVTVPNSYASLPPSTKSVKLDGLLAEMPAQTAWELSGATLDGSTPNYLKLAYTNASSSSRTRAISGGSYVYDQTASFTLTCTPVAATDTEVLLATIVGDGASTMTITPVATLVVAQNTNSATTLQNTRTFDVSGLGFTCSAQNFNGSANVTLPLAYVSSQGAAGTWDTSGTAPDQTTRLNYNGYLYATKIYNAVYADLAEFMDKDPSDDSSPGDVLVQTERGLVKSFKRAHKAVVGVYSDSFGYALGAHKKENKYPIGLSGIVFVKVQDPMEIGDLLVSGENGFAVKATDKESKTPGIVLGKVLENKNNTFPSRIKILIYR
jgi:hypothetical protein